jgi:hypothetical protein
MKKLLYSFIFLLIVIFTVVLYFKLTEKEVDTKAQEQSANDTASVRFETLNESFDDFDEENSEEQ